MEERYNASEKLKHNKDNELLTEALNVDLSGVRGSVSHSINYCPKCKCNDVIQYTKNIDKCNNCNHAWYTYNPFKGVK